MHLFDHTTGGVQLRIFIEDLGNLPQLLCVLVIGPTEERSGASHSLSLTHPVGSDRAGVASGIRPLCNHQGPWGGGLSLTVRDLLGFVILGFRKILERLPDLVVSGMNHGANLGEDVLYSGTVAAAREAALHGIPSFAVSTLGKQKNDFEHASEVLRHLVEFLWSRVEGGTFLNINIPEGQPGEYRFTRQGSRRITSGIAEKTDLRGRTYYWIGADQSQWMVAPDSDYEAILGGRISITPMHLVQTDYQTLADLQQLGLGALDSLESSK